MMEIDIVLVLARWLHFASLMAVFGSALFSLYALPPSIGGTAQLAITKIDRDIRFATYIALASGVVWVARSIMVMTDDPTSLLDRQTFLIFFMQTSFGPAWLIRLILLIILATIASPAWAKHNPSACRLTRACLAGAALASQAWLGHAAMATGSELCAELGCYMMHVVAAGAWIGGLVPLGYMLADPEQQGRSGSLARRTVLIRFSNLGIFAVSLIFASGIANTAFRLSSIADLIGTPYGLAILGKALLFFSMLAVAALNRWLLMPRLERDTLSTISSLRRNILFEQVLAGLVLGGAAILGTLPP